MTTRTPRQQLATAARELAQIHHALKQWPLDLPPILPWLDSVATRLGMAVDHLENGDISVLQNARSAHYKASEAHILLREGHNRAPDWIEVATALVLLARFRAQEALWASEDSDLMRERCSVGYGKEG